MMKNFIRIKWSMAAIAVVVLVLFALVGCNESISIPGGETTVTIFITDILDTKEPPALVTDAESTLETVADSVTESETDTEPEMTVESTETTTEDITECPHEGTEWQVTVEPTCTRAGSKIRVCNICNQLMAEEEIPALEHSAAIDAAVAPTCTEAGLTEGKHCSVCGAVLVAQDAIPASSHTEVIDPAVAPTCTQTGLTEGRYCSVCEGVLAVQETVPALGHHFVDGYCERCFVEKAHFNQWTTYRSPTDYNTSPTPGYEYTADGFHMITADFTGTFPYGTLQTKDPVNIKDGVYMELRIDDYSYGGEEGWVDHWIAFHIWDSQNIAPGNTKYGQGWLGLIRTSNDKVTVFSTKSSDREFKYLNRNGQTIKPRLDENGKEIYTLEVRHTNYGYTVLICGVAVAGADIITEHLYNLNPNGEFYIGVTFHSSVQNGVCDATVLKFGNAKETAITPRGDEAVAPQAAKPHVHVEETVPGKAPTCTENGYTEWSRCSDCGAVLVEQITLPATGHSAVYTPGRAPTCTEVGLTDGESCQTCGEILMPQYFLEPTGHDEQVIPGVEPTPTEDGLSDGIVCSTCGEILLPQEKIPALGEEEIILPPANVWDGSVASGFAGGNGTEGNPYLISTGAQLAYLETVAYKDGYNDKHYKLTNPIDLNGLEWEPITMSGYDFYFDGNGYTISNFKITKKNYSCYGLFSKVGRGTIANLGVTDFEINVTSKYESYAGGLAGYLSWSTIENCHAIGTVTLTSSSETVMVGGLVGYAEDTDAIRGCYSDGTVSGSSRQSHAYAGGLVGKTWSKYSSRTTLENNYSTAQVTAESNDKSSYAGGLVGSVSLENDSALCITNSFTAGPVTAIAHTKYAYAASGGLAGSISIYHDGSVALQGCYATGDIASLWGSSCYYTYNCHLVGYTIGEVTVDNCYHYENQYAENWVDGIHGTPCTRVQLNSVSFYTDVLGWDKTIWKLSYLSFVSGKYPVLFAPIPGSSPEHVHTEEIIPGVEPTYTENGLTSGVRCSTCGKILVPQEIIPSLGSQDPANQVWDGSIATGFAGGSGTEEDPYLISTGAQLAFLAQAINTNSQNEYYHRHYRLTNSINLGGREWEPIGCYWYTFSTKRAFRGQFDGNGYEISNFKITYAKYATDGGYGVDIGLFGHIAGASIKNLGVTDFEIHVNTAEELNIGGLVGFSENGTIANCYALGNIIASNCSEIHAGGLVGGAGPAMGYGFAATGTITNCYAGVDIQITVTDAGESDPFAGIASAGGLVGTFPLAEISDCYATGSIRATSYNSAYAGGLVGGFGGGVVANHSSLLANCYATGNAYAQGVILARAGGLVGLCSENGDINNCYRYENQIVEIGGTVGTTNDFGAFCTLSKLNNASFYTDTLGWRTSIWNLSSLDFENGKSPTLF